MNTAADGKLITCILPRGKAVEIVELLRDEKGVDSADVTSGRGSGVAGSVSYGAWSEVDILTVVVSADQEADTFEFIYDKAEIGQVYGGFMYEVSLAKSTPFALPDIPAQDQE